MAESIEEDSPTATKEIPPNVLRQHASSQSSYDELIRQKDYECIKFQNTKVGFHSNMSLLQAGAVLQDHKSSLIPSRNNVGSPKNPSCRGDLEDSGTAFVADGAEFLEQSAENDRHNGHRHITHIHPERFKSSTASGANTKTESPLPSSPIKYVLCYRQNDGTRFKDHIVRNVESLEPMLQDLHAQGDGILEVTRTVFIQEMQIDFTKPLTEQSISIEDFGPHEIKINSIAIISALYSVVSYWPGLSLNTPSLVIQEPFAILYHHRTALQEYADSKSSATDRKDGERCEREQNVDTHLKLLFDFLDNRPEAKKLELERERDLIGRDLPLHLKCYGCSILQVPMFFMILKGLIHLAALS